MVYGEMNGSPTDASGTYGSIGESESVDVHNTSSISSNQNISPLSQGHQSPRVRLNGNQSSSSVRITMNNNQGLSSGSTSSSSSVIVEENEDAAYTNNDLFQRQPLINDDPSCHKNGYDHRTASTNGMVRIPITLSSREEPRFPKEKMKTLKAFIFLFMNWIFTTASLALTHERVPDIAPLPDVVLDSINKHSWGLEAAEIMIIISTYFCTIVVIFHKHRFIIFRRIFLIMGLLYFYRSITMFVTVLPKSDPEYYCSPKANATTFVLVVKRIAHLISGFGLSINGQHTFCGDYIYSGHTVCLVMAYLVVKEYTPKRWWILHWAFALFATLGIVFVLIARGHYTVDCVIAYYITTRLFYIYHTVATNQYLKEIGSNNYFVRLWWYPIFEYFEVNVHGVVPRQYEWPLPWPRRWASKNPQRTS